MPRSGWHRVFRPLCGADPTTLLGPIARNGQPTASGLLRLGIALASSIGRLPFTTTERAWTAPRCPAASAIVQVRFEELEQNPLAELERIYRSIPLGDYGAARPCIEAYLYSIRDYTKSTYAWSKARVEEVTDASSHS